MTLMICYSVLQLNISDDKRKVIFLTKQKGLKAIEGKKRIENKIEIQSCVIQSLREFGRT
jgi:hypothetical protein